ncbi:hypothetical protein E2C01_058875 [Portunus trituberculatus]|uniref:Uncharacterized protein n=1 Tax=Portunus trituberculatus TaxID=210409 RepID=A0A5B7H5D0_PORTR|nr:hypothetical protein [Portunus trituberculatus]
MYCLHYVIKIAESANCQYRTCQCCSLYLFYFAIVLHRLYQCEYNSQVEF